VWRWLATAYDIGTAPTLPVPMLNIINGGEHANNGIDVQEFMVVPHGFGTFTEALEAAVSIFHRLKGELDSRGLSTAVGDEGGFAPNLPRNVDALDLLVEAIDKAGYSAGSQVSVALDVAATELYRDGKYVFAGDDATLDAAGVVDLYEGWMRRGPIVSIEDGMSEDDFDGWRLLTERLGNDLQLVGDDLFVTNPARLREGIDAGLANALLVKVNQIGTLSETIAAMATASEAGYRNVMSHRSGETEDTTIADLAVGTSCGQGEDRCAEPQRSRGQVQPVAADRGGTGRGCPLRTPLRGCGPSMSLMTTPSHPTSLVAQPAGMSIAGLEPNRRIRHTKIVCTIGPATSDPAVLRQMVECGMNVVRLNFSHGEHGHHEAVVREIRAIAKELRRPLAIIADLQGPKVRIGDVPGSVSSLPETC